MLTRQFTEEQAMFRRPTDDSRRGGGARMERFRERTLSIGRSSRRLASRLSHGVAGERYGGMDDYDIRWEQVIIEELAYARCSDWFGSIHSRVAPTSPALAVKIK